MGHFGTASISISLKCNADLLQLGQCRKVRVNVIRLWYLAFVLNAIIEERFGSVQFDKREEQDNLAIPLADKSQSLDIGGELQDKRFATEKNLESMSYQLLE